MDYKAVATITWRFESQDGMKDCLEYAKKKLEEILNCNPHGTDFLDFNVSLDLTSMKTKNKLIHLAEFDPNYIFSMITENEIKREFEIDGRTYYVKMNSQRYHLFRENSSCVCCGIVGNKMVLDMNLDSSVHFNLYAEDNGRLVLMTKDHIVPKSLGGPDELNNYQTMCCICNNLKGSSNLELEDIRNLKDIWENHSKLPKKELRKLINMTRSKLEKEKEVRSRTKKEINNEQFSERSTIESACDEVGQESVQVASDSC